MKVRVVKWRGFERIVDLEDALTPSGDENMEASQAERARAQANAACDAMGKLLAHLVGTNVLALDKAAEIAGRWEDLYPVEEEEKS